jgi:hypothetical protein
VLRLEEAAARRESEVGESEKLREPEWARQQVPSFPSPPSPHRHCTLTPYPHSRPPPHPPNHIALDLTFAPTCIRLLSTAARSHPAASSQQPAEPPPPPSKWGLPEPQDFAAHRATPRRAVCDGSPVLAPVARRAGTHALPRGARCGGCGISSPEDAFAGGSCGSILGVSFTGTGNSDAALAPAPAQAPAQTTSARLRHLGCSPNPFPAPALGALFGAALPPPGCGALEGDFERIGSFDFDAAFSGVPSWFLSLWDKHRL